MDGLISLFFTCFFKKPDLKKCSSKNLLLKESEVFINPNSFGWIFYLTCMPMRMIITHFS
jgi:hypothetical protein